MLNLRQQSVYDFIVDYRRIYGRSPLNVEIQRRFDWAAPSAVTDVLAALERKGAIAMDSQRARRRAIPQPLRRLIEVPAPG